MPDPIYAFQIMYSINIAGTVLIHNHRIGAKLADAEPAPITGTPLSDINLATRGVANLEGSISALTGLSSYLAVFGGIYGAEMNVLNAALVHYPAGLGGSFIYIAPADLTDAVNFNPIGTLPFPCMATQQVIVSMFDNRGRISKMVLMETPYDATTRRSASELTVEQLLYVNNLSNEFSTTRGAESSSLLSMKVWNNTQNESTYRARYRG